MRQTFTDLSRYVRRYPGRYLAGLLTLVLSGYFATLIPLIVGNAVDAFTRDAMTLDTVWGYIGALVGATVIAALSTIVVRRTILNASWEIQFDIRRDLFEHFTRLDSAFFDDNRVGDLMARLTADLNAVRMFVGVAIFQGVNTIFLLGFTLWRMFQLSTDLTLLTLLMVPMIVASFFLLLRSVHKRYERVQQQFSNVSAMAQENFNGIRVVKGFGIEDREIENFKRLNDDFIQRNLKLTKVEGPMFPLMEFLFGATISLLLLLGGRTVLGAGGALSIGEFSAFVFLFEGIQWPLIALGWIANIVQRGVTSWGRLAVLLQTKPRITDGVQTDYSLRTVRGEIEFRDVTLRFDDFTALDRVSFKIRAGEAVGITGRTGAGKTLIVNLIGRTVEPTEGQILIDGIDIKRFPLEVLRRHIGLVPQEPFLFSDTIAENIAFGIPKDDSEQRAARIREVAQLAQLAGDVDGFPQGFDTSLGERGVTLSGGQRQRTAIARAIIRDPSILILDDALSAVDIHTESEILKGLVGVQKGRSTLVIAHRLSAFQNCNRIYVLADGRITEDGTHQQLVEHDGWYADMHRRQQLEADLEAA
ncbi:MAG: ABC transporter ATP-binding protein [Trueperaceae bacterium]